MREVKREREQSLKVLMRIVLMRIVLMHIILAL